MMQRMMPLYALRGRMLVVAVFIMGWAAVLSETNVEDQNRNESEFSPHVILAFFADISAACEGKCNISAAISPGCAENTSEFTSTVAPTIAHAAPLLRSNTLMLDAANAAEARVRLACHPPCAASEPTKSLVVWRNSRCTSGNQLPAADGDRWEIYEGDSMVVHRFGRNNTALVVEESMDMEQRPVCLRLCSFACLIKGTVATMSITCPALTWGFLKYLAKVKISCLRLTQSTTKTVFC
jgi:hypothetical protein